MRHWAREAGTPIGRRRAGHAAIVAGCAWLWSSAVFAQVSGSVGVVSDYRYRGYSLSAGDPAAQASVGYDAASGLYGGLFASTTRYAGNAGAQWIPYAGFARRDARGRSWDVGVRHVGFTHAADYTEAHVGVANQHLALRLHYAPDYHGSIENAYLEAEFALPVGERVRLLFHGGVSRSGAVPGLRPSDPLDDGYATVPYGDRHETPGRTGFDASAGFVVRTGLCDVQAIWHHGSANGVGLGGPWDPNDRSGFVLGCFKRW